jgi:hypothetical protein
MPQIPNKPVRMVPMDELIALLERAEKMGFDMGPGSELERLTIEEIEALVMGAPN